MHLLPKVREAMVGENQITILATPHGKLCAHSTDEAIQPLIPILHHIHSIGEKHMLHAIQIIKNTGKYTFSKIIHQVLKDLHTAIEDRLAEIQKLVITHTTIFKTSGILGPA